MCGQCRDLGGRTEGELLCDGRRGQGCRHNTNVSKLLLVIVDQSQLFFQSVHKVREVKIYISYEAADDYHLFHMFVGEGVGQCSHSPVQNASSSFHSTSSSRGREGY
jgi:hypothetical protein